MTDLPSNFDHNKTVLCGFSYPQATPFSNISSACCKAPAQTSNGCFQYCATDLDEEEFQTCISGYVNLSAPSIVDCNRDAKVRGKSAAGRVDGRSKWVFGALVALVCFNICFM